MLNGCLKCNVWHYIQIRGEKIQNPHNKIIIIILKIRNIITHHIHDKIAWNDFSCLNILFIILSILSLIILSFFKKKIVIQTSNQ